MPRKRGLTAFIWHCSKKNPKTFIFTNKTRTIKVNESTIGNDPNYGI